MKIIDEKGRLFSKINIIDFLLILFLFFLAPMFYFGYQLFARKPLSFQGEVIQQEIDCKFIKLTPEQIKYIAVGDKEFDENGKIIGEIISLDKIEPYVFELNIGSAEKWFKEDPILKQVKAKLRLNVDSRSGSLYYKNSLLSDNSDFEFKADKYRVFAVYRYEELEERMLDVDIQIKDLQDDTIKLISVGDRSLDEKGQVLAEILKIGQVNDNYLIIDLKSGNYITARDEQKKQLSVRMRIRCQVSKRGEFYFRGKRIEYNIPFEFKTDKYKVKAVLTPSFVEEKWLPIEVRFSGVIPDVANLLKGGDIEKDNSGRIIGKIKLIIDVKNSPLYAFSVDRFIRADNPFQKDILVTLDLLCTKNDDRYFYKDFPIRVGNSIIFTTDLYSVSGTIVKMSREL